MKHWLAQRTLTAVVAAGLLSTTAIAGSMTALSGSAQAATRKAASNVTLTMESSPTNTLTRSFNPFSTTSAIYLVAGTSFIYEPLLQFDAAKAGVVYDWLATSYHFGDGGKSVTFTIRKGVKWSDGSPLTPADVAFTYNLVKKNAAINTFGLDITGVSTAGDTVTIDFPTPQYTNLQNIASVYIVPEKIWSTVGNPATFTDPNPVGSGPYVVGTYTPQGFTLTKNPSYWQAGNVRIGTLDFPAYATNTNAEEALFSGQLDWAGNFIPNLKQLFLSKSKYNTAWEAPLNTVTLEPNLSKFPFNDVAVRKAISLAVNRQQLSSQGEANLEPAAINASGLTLPVFGAYLSPSVAGATLSRTPQVAAAKKVLEADGWKMGSNGYFQKNGKTLSFSIQDPSSYSDYAADGAIIAQNLRAAGMDVTFQGLSVTAWSNDVASGTFDSVIHWSNTSQNPYGMYNGWLNSALDTPKSAAGDYEGLHSSVINRELAAVASAPTLAAEKARLAPIESYMANNLPLIPLVYGVAWSEVNGQQITGWPTPSNPYESAQPATPTNEVVVLHLRPRG